jgi:predicted dehydrogenase
MTERNYFEEVSQDVWLLAGESMSEQQRKQLKEGDFLRLGLVGCGGISAIRHHPSLHGLPVTLAAVCDRDEARVTEYARVLGGEKAYTDHLKMLADAELDAVIVAVGAGGHPQIAIDVMEAGLPVLTEKPPSLTAEGAREMLDVSRRTGQICMTAFNMRFSTSFIKAREIVKKDEFGPQSLLAITWESPPLYEEDPNDPMTSFMLDFAIHVMDLSRYFFGEVAEVYARQCDADAFAVTLAFVNGAVGTLSLSSRPDHWMTEQVELRGAPGQAVTVSDGREVFYYRGKEIADWRRLAFTVTDSFAENGYRGELVEFLAAIQEQREPESSISSAYQTMRLYDAIKLSAAERRVVSLSDSE